MEGGGESGEGSNSVLGPDWRQTLNENEKETEGLAQWVKGPRSRNLFQCQELLKSRMRKALRNSS